MDPPPPRLLGLSRRWLLAALCGVFLIVLLAVVAVGTQAHYSQQILPAPAKSALQNPVAGAVGQLATVIILGGAEILLVLVLIFFPWGDFKHIGKATPVPVRMRRRDSLKLVALAFGMLIALIVLLALGLKRRKKPFHLAGPTAAGSSSAHPAEAHSLKCALQVLQVGLETLALQPALAERLLQAQIGQDHGRPGIPAQGELLQTACHGRGQLLRQLGDGGHPGGERPPMAVATRSKEDHHSRYH